jgi:hypothetical protein
MNNFDKIIDSIKIISEFPFYTANYFGDYKLDQLINGAISSPDLIVPFFDDLFITMGKPHSINLPKHIPMPSACSAFCCFDQQNNLLIGKNLDWKKTSVLLLKTTPSNGYKSLSLVDLELCDFFNLGSFNHSLILSPYVPFDGMNEKGLVVTMLSIHKELKYPFDKNKVTIGDFNLIRVLLDKCSNVDESIKMINNFSIMQTGPFPIHYLIADTTNSCIVEFIDGKVFVVRNEQNKYLTNNLVTNDIDFENNLNNCKRFSILHSSLSNNNKNFNMLLCMDLLNKVSVFSNGYSIPSTIWSIIYAPKTLELSIKIGKENNWYKTQL